MAFQVCLAWGLGVWRNSLEPAADEAADLEEEFFWPSLSHSSLVPRQEDLINLKQNFNILHLILTLILTHTTVTSIFKYEKC